MKTEIVNVTPSKAKQWLERNTDNRPLRQTTVRGLAAAIQRGEWKLTHQGIAFGKSGKMLDGQHRCAAIVEAGLTVPMMVTWDEDDDAFAALDVGVKRSNADSLRITNALASVARFLAIVDDTQRSVAPTPQQLVPFVKAVEPYLSDLLAFTPSTTKTWASAAVRAAAIIRMMDGEDFDYVKLVYHSLVHSEFDAMPAVAHTLVRQHMSGSVRGASADMFVRCLKVFDIENRRQTKLQINSVEPGLRYAREVIAKEVHGERKAPATKAGGAKKAVNVSRNSTSKATV